MTKLVEKIIEHPQFNFFLNYEDFPIQLWNFYVFLKFHNFHQIENEGLIPSKLVIAFLKWEKKVHYFSHMGNNSSLLFSNGKRNIIVFLKKEKVAHIGFPG